MIKILFICTFIASFTWGNKTDTLTPDSPKSIHGIVTDSVTGKPIPEVIIMVKGTEIGTVTNAEGHYKMVTLKNSALVFSKEGMKTQEIPVGEAVHCNFVINKSIHTRMKYLAIEKNMSLRDIVNEAMREYLEKHEK